MSSTLKQAVKDIKGKVLTIPSFTYCAVWNNQVKKEDGGLTFDFPKPAIFIEVQSPTTGVECLGAFVTVNEWVINVYIVHEQLNAEYDANLPGSGMDENLDVMDLRDLIKANLTQFKPTNCSLLQYHEESLDYDHDNIYVYRVAFKCSYADVKGSPANNWIMSTPPLALDLDVYYTTPHGKQTRIAYGWKVCPIQVQVVDYPDGSTQLLGNGDTIPLQYALNGGGYDYWVSGTSYTIGDIINFNGGRYACTGDNTDIDFDINNWLLIQYNTLTIPYLATYAGIEVLTPFIINSGIVQSEPYDNTTGTFDNTVNGGFNTDIFVSFNASLPLYTA